MSKRYFEELLTLQKKFSDSIFDSSTFTHEEKIEKHKTFCLALQSEVAELADSVHYKEHRKSKTATDRQKILYETIDILRYSFAMLNLWQFSSEDIIDAFDSRDASLWDKKDRAISEWSGQNVAIVDVDDVIAKFREGFFGWLNDNFGLSLTTEMPEYYYSGKAGDLTGEEAFMLFIEQGGFRKLDVNDNVLRNLNELKQKGYWIQLLTARPYDNVKCMYDTYWWLKKMKIPYDNVAFSYEKYRWLSDKKFYKEGFVKFAVDDSPKHSAEYASQGVKTYVPERSYNSEVWGLKNITTFDWNTGTLGCDDE